MPMGDGLLLQAGGAAAGNHGQEWRARVYQSPTHFSHSERDKDNASMSQDGSCMSEGEKLMAGETMAGKGHGDPASGETHSLLSGHKSGENSRD